MTVNLSKSQREMVKASAYGLNTGQVEQLIADVAAELEALGVPVTRNHIRAATTKVLARGK
jgi:hypothetical protein